MRKIFKILVLISCLTLFPNGCGNQDDGVAVFETVTLSANCQVASCDSDVIEWRQQDPNSDSDYCDDAIIFPDSVSVGILSELLPKYTEGTSSDIRIESVRLDYCPADTTTPELASQTLALGKIIKPGEVNNIEVRIVSQGQKEQLLDELFYDPFCDGDPRTDEPIYRYHLQLTFKGIETMTNRKGNFVTGLNLQISNFADEDCELNPAYICQ